MLFVVESGMKKKKEDEIRWISDMFLSTDRDSRLDNAEWDTMRQVREESRKEEKRRQETKREREEDYDSQTLVINFVVLANHNTSSNAAFLPPSPSFWLSGSNHPARPSKMGPEALEMVRHCAAWD
jgi:hypothetical protein